MTYLSYSGFESYQKCPALYKNRYIEKLTQVIRPSPLHFGNAIDSALNVMLLQKKPDLTPQEVLDAKLGPFTIFHQRLYTLEVPQQGQSPRIETTPTSPFIDYLKSDFDATILKNEDWRQLDQYIQNAGYQDEHEQAPKALDLYKSLAEMKLNQKLNLIDTGYYNYANYLSLLRKGELFLEEYRVSILPQIQKVITSQRSVDLPNAIGDHYVGKLDATLQFVGDAPTYLIDHKTSGSPYSQKDVNRKPQLASYAEAEGENYGAYIVMNKKIQQARKCSKCGHVERGNRVTTCNIGKPRCNGTFEAQTIPWAELYIVKDQILEETKDRVFSEIEQVLLDIKAGKFEKNLDACMQFGQMCPFYYKCRSKDNLDHTTIQLVKEKKKSFKV